MTTAVDNIHAPLNLKTLWRYTNVLYLLTYLQTPVQSYRHSLVRRLVICDYIACNQLRRSNQMTNFVDGYSQKSSNMLNVEQLFSSGSKI